MACVVVLITNTENPLFVAAFSALGIHVSVCKIYAAAFFLISANLLLSPPKSSVALQGSDL